LKQHDRQQTIKARTKMQKHETLGQEVQQKQKNLASELLNAEASMEQASSTAYQQHAIATRELDGAKHRAVSRRKDAEAT
jgi:hypothetical protein